MNAAHAHLMFNHFPVILPIAGLIAFVVGLAIQSDVVRRLAFFFFILGALSAFPAGFSGENAEDLVESLPGVDSRLIHEHEEAAERFVPLMYLCGLLSLLTLWLDWKRRHAARWMTWVVVATVGITLYFGFMAANTGGEIRHPEIRAEAATLSVPSASEYEKEE
jgi:uncharacterized membrane protein